MTMTFIHSDSSSRRNNYYNVSLSQEQKNALTNIQPYIIPDDEILISWKETFQTYVKEGTLNSTGGLFCLDPDSSNRILVLINHKDLFNFSQTSKCCYLAAKNDFIWQNQLKKLFPGIQVIRNDGSRYSSGQQSKIYFRYFYLTLKPFKEQFNALQSRVNNLNGALETARREFKGGKKELKALQKLLEVSLKTLTSEERQTLLTNHSAHKAYEQCNHLQDELIQIKGSPSESDEIPNEQSLIGRCLSAIDEFIPNDFNNQENFKNHIQKFESINN